MKNKLLKTLTCFVSVFTIGSTIAITSTSCGSSSEVTPSSDVLPDKVYDIQDNVLMGFKDGIDLSQYENICDTILIPASVTSIADNAFFVNTSTSVNASAESTIPSYITKLTFDKNSNCSAIGDYAFGYSSLTCVTLPLSLTTIGIDAFKDCSKLNDIKWNSWAGSESINLSSTSFSGVCPTSGTVTVANPVDGHDSDELLKYLLDNGGLPQTWAKPIPLPESVYNIQDNVLRGFTSEFLANPSAYSEYNTIQIPASVTSINEYAFYSLFSASSTIPSYITKLTFAEGSNCSSIGDWAFEGSTLTSITFLSGLKTIGEYAFSGCSLPFITFPSSLESIGEEAFSSCSSLTSVSFPSSLTLIDSNAFSYCWSLNYIGWDLPEEYETDITIISGAFDSISSSGTVKSLNLSIASSQQLLDWIKTSFGFPQTGWEPAD